MEKKALADPPPRKQSRNAPSDIQSNEDCITFISLSHFEMHKLVHDTESFTNKVKSINNQAKKQIQLGAYKQALSLLSQGEKILQYAAGSGKTIQRQLIVCVLHNIAAGYQKLWMLQKCIRYVEGLIFNLENHLNSLQSSVMSSNQRQEMMVAIQSMDMRHMLAAYSIRFCALSSQQYNHKQALMSAKKAIGYVKNIFMFDQSYVKNMLKQEEDMNSKIHLKYQLLIEILQFEGAMNIKKHKDILKAAHFSIQIWNKAKEKYTNHKYQFLKIYSIGDFMDFKPKQYHAKNQTLPLLQRKTKQFQSSLAYKLLLLSISFFSASTQIRLSQSDTHYFSQLDREGGSHLLQAEIYNLLAIIIIGAFLPFDILYLRHILNSYSNYFNSGLVEYKTVEQESYQKIIELISDNQYKSPALVSTEIISEQILPDIQTNQYKLNDRFMEKAKLDRKNFHKSKKISQPRQNTSQNFSRLQTKSLIKSDKTLSKTKQPLKMESKLKSKSKSKSKSKTLQKKSKDKDRLYFVKITTSKSKKKINQEELGSLSKKLSPKKVRDPHGSKESVGSDIIYKQRKKSLLNHKVSLTKKLLNDNKSPKRRNNIYGLHN